MTLISVVTITKDDLDGVKKTVLSLSALKKLGVNQLIIDGSDLEISKNVKKLAVDNGADYFWLKPSGVASAFNFGLSKTDSEWVWFLNGGDSMINDFNCKTLIDLLENSSSDAISFQTRMGKSILKKPPLYMFYPPVYNWIPHPSTFVRRSVLQKIGGFDEKYKIASDGDLWFKLIHLGAKFDFVAIPITNFSKGGISSDLSKLTIEQKQVVFSNFFTISLNLLKRFWQMINFLFFS